MRRSSWAVFPSYLLFEDLKDLCCLHQPNELQNARKANEFNGCENAIVACSATLGERSQLEALRERDRRREVDPEPKGQVVLRNLPPVKVQAAVGDERRVEVDAEAVDEEEHIEAELEEEPWLVGSHVDLEKGGWEADMGWEARGPCGETRVEARERRLVQARVERCKGGEGEGVRGGRIRRNALLCDSNERRAWRRWRRPAARL